MARSDFWYSMPFRVRYAECDMQGIVFNGIYFTYFDTAITEYLRAMDYSLIEQVETTGTDFHVVKALAEFAAPVRFDDHIDVCVRTGRIGKSSIQFLLEIHPHGGDRVLTTGEIVWVNAYQGKHESAPVPEKLAAAIREREAA